MLITSMATRNIMDCQGDEQLYVFLSLKLDLCLYPTRLIRQEVDVDGVWLVFLEPKHLVTSDCL